NATANTSRTTIAVPKRVPRLNETEDHLNAPATDSPDAYGPCINSAITLPKSSNPTPASTSRRPLTSRPHSTSRPRALSAPPGQSTTPTTAPPSARASPRNATPRPMASSVRTVALEDEPASKITWLGAPTLNENAPDTGCESDETTRHATT